MPTGPHSPEARKQISETKKARAREERASRLLPERKRCSQCKTYKDRKKFGLIKRPVADGDYSLHLRSQCLECDHKRKIAAQERMGPEEVKRRNAAYGKAYRDRKKKAKAERAKNLLERVDAEPFAKFLDEFHATFDLALDHKRDKFLTFKEWCAEKGVSYEQAAQIKSRVTKTTNLAYIDKFLIAAEVAHLLPILYPTR